NKLLNNEFIHSRNKLKLKLDVTRDVDKHYYWGEFERENIKFFKSLVRQGQTIFDVGANIGIYSLTAARVMNNSGRVYCFEPSDWAYNRLRENVAINRFSNIEIIKKGVSNKSGTIDFYICHDDAYNSIGSKPMMEVEKVVPIQVTTIDEFCDAQKIPHIDILKIDAEGADYLILKGAKVMISKQNAPIIFCEFNRSISDGFDFSKNDFINYLVKNSFSAYELKDNKLVEFKHDSSSNEIICLKPEHILKFNLQLH
ncbi:MAG: FkbM family methyltransferase, partial [Ignavibacteriaceae bacterium]|nr:FkbM family methyltransferase [Ignavibacteriaceae bacterium]